MMGIPFLGQKKQRRGRAMTGSERQSRLEAAWLEKLRNRNPALFDKIMLQRIGFRDGEQQDSSFEDTIERISVLNKIYPVREQKEESSLERALAHIAPGIAMVFAQQMQQTHQQPPMPQVRVQEPAALEHAPSIVEAAPIAEDAEDVEEVDSMSFMSQLVISQLQKKTPDQAAQWLLQQATARPVLEHIAASSDDNLPALLAEWSQKAPDFVGFINWLRARPDWLLATVHAVRARLDAEKRPNRGKMGVL